MSEQVTVTLPDELLQRAQVWAAQTGCPLEDFLAETIELSLAPLGEAPIPSAALTDEEVVEALEFDLPSKDQEQLSQLLERQREQAISGQEATELRRLMTQYQEGLLRKAIAMREAVERGLRPAPLP